MSVTRVARGILLVVAYTTLLLLSLGFIVLGTKLSSDGHWIAGLVVVVSGIIGCRVTATAMNRWHSGCDE